ncbi:YidB family protein [Falsiroseomonas sp. CW058]|uniref:YidB family protein n=1 Tax=Falsiroseomonas sp. CW058 TaxID=3388664 RepID=UPI003D310ABF
MSDVLSRILNGVLGGGAGGGMMGGGGSSPLGTPRLPGDEAGRSGGMFGGGVAPGGGLGGLSGALGGGMGGGLGGILGGLLGGAGRSPMGGTLGGLAGGLGGVKGMALMALLAYMMRGRGGASGLSSLTDHLRGSGLGPQVDSWIGPGRNEDVRPEELARAIPPEMLDEVQQHTGMGRDEILSQLSRGLPGMVDRLTPQGRLPERDDELNDHDEGDLLSGFGIGPTRRT